MYIALILVFGAIGLIFIFSTFDFLMQGVAIGNSSASASNYAGFNEIINALPWIVPLLFVFILAIIWWTSRKRR